MVLAPDVPALTQQIVPSMASSVAPSIHALISALTLLVPPLEMEPEVPLHHCSSPAPSKALRMLRRLITPSPSPKLSLLLPLHCTQYVQRIGCMAAPFYTITVPLCVIPHLLSTIIGIDPHDLQGTQEAGHIHLDLLPFHPIPSITIPRGGYIPQGILHTEVTTGTATNTITTIDAALSPDDAPAQDCHTTTTHMSPMTPSTSLLHPWSWDNLPLPEMCLCYLSTLNLTQSIYRNRTSHKGSLTEQSSLSPDKAVFPGDCSPTDDACQFQDPFKHMVESQEVQQLTQVQQKQHRLLKNLQPSQKSMVALPLNDAILEVADEIWQTSASALATNKWADKKYFIPSKGMTFLFMHPQPNSLVVDAAQQRVKTPRHKTTPADKEGKRLDLLGRKVYSSATITLRMANYDALLSNHNFDIYTKLVSLLEHLPENKREILKLVVQEGYTASGTVLQIALDIADTAARTTTTSVVMC
ncbi:uncharacterized protein LOC102450114 [Pelodiscus sinensis]|uniref:uncharacterized protein LOC102450114 n=1 Tax=Pelodiscus sinensis TaxID=13735 RepID=UPI003F6CA545